MILPGGGCKLTVGFRKSNRLVINRQLKLNKSDNEIEKFNFAFN